MIVDAGELPESIVQKGVHLGQRHSKGFSRKVAEDEGHWIDKERECAGLPEDTLCFELHLKAGFVLSAVPVPGGADADENEDEGDVRLRAGARGGKKKQRVLWPWGSLAFRKTLLFVLAVLL